METLCESLEITVVTLEKALKYIHRLNAASGMSLSELVDKLEKGYRIVPPEILEKF